MLFLTLEDLNGTLNVILFPEVSRIAKSMLDSNTPLQVSGVMEMDAQRGEPFLIPIPISSPDHLFIPTRQIVRIHHYPIFRYLPGDQFS